MLFKTPELELKFTAAADLSIAALAAQAAIGTVTELPALDLLAMYYDTDDLRLARAGVTLRHRSGDVDGSVWTVKFPSRDGADLRNEVNIHDDAGRVPEEARNLVTVFTRGSRLLPVATLRTKRRRWSLRESDGRELAELVDDRVSVLEGQKIKERFRELEIEARSLDRAGLEDIAAALTELGAVQEGPTPKVVRALGPRAAEPSDLPEVRSVSARNPVGDAVMVALASAVCRLVMHDPDARLNDPEGVHQMRVAARRLRGHLRTFSSLVEPEWSDAIIEELRWLARALGEVRDLDVLVAHLTEAAEDLRAEITPMLDSLEERRAMARQSLKEILNSERYIALVERLIKAAKVPALTDAAREPCRSSLPRLVRQTWEPIAGAVKDLREGGTDERYHKVRIEAKRMRYAAEAAVPCLGRQLGRDALRFAQHAEEVQNVLGARQDWVVMRQTLIEEAKQRPQDGPFNLAAGRLIERQNQSIAKCDERFSEVWRTLNRKKNREWLNR